jgi:hypothetical protein
MNGWVNEIVQGNFDRFAEIWLHSRPQRESAVDVLAHRPVTFAARRLQLAAIDDLDAATAVFYHAGTLQRSRHERDRGAAAAWRCPPKAEARGSNPFGRAIFWSRNLHGVKIFSHSERYCLSRSAFIFVQSILITLMAPNSGTQSGTGLLKPLRPEISASRRQMML